MLSPGTAFLLAYLPARRVAHNARRELVDRNAATIDSALKHAIEFSRQALNVDEKIVAEWDARHATLAKEAGIAPIPAGGDLSAWLAALPDRVRLSLSTPVLQAAWKAGEAGRRVAISIELAAHIAYLRCAAPQNPDLRAQAAERARALTESAAALTRDLEATGLPLVISNAGNVAKMVKLTSDLEPTTTDGYRQLNELMNDLRKFLDTKARQLDTPPPVQASAAPTPEEEKLLAQIIAAPHDTSLRTQFAKLAQRRNDPRAELIRLQYSGNGQEANDLIRSHPEWSTPLQQLGARDIKFSGGFPDEITIDAETLLSRGKELLAAAPVTRLHVRNANGRVADIVRSPLLATIEALDLDSGGVTDEDLIALAASPHAARLRQLDLRYNPLSARGIEAIAASPHGKRLEVVNLDGNPADPVDRQEYYDETNSHFVPTDAGKALEAKYGPLRWLHRN